MAHSLSSKKRIRQNTKRRALNRARSAAIKTKLRTCTAALSRGSIEDAQRTCQDAVRTLDREANRGTLHPNAAARRKSRLARRLNALRQKAAGPSA